MTEEEIDSLNFDSKEEDHPWPLNLKIALSLIVSSTMLVIGVLGGAWYLHTFHTEDPYAPISFVAPARVTNSFGVVPEIVAKPELPLPSLRVPDSGVPVQLTRTVDCITFECPSGGMSVLVDVSWIEVNIEGTTISAFNIMDHKRFVYESGLDYYPNTVSTVSNSLAEFEIPKMAYVYLKNQHKEFSAWKIEGVTTPDTSNGVSAAWATETFHIWVPEAKE